MNNELLKINDFELSDYVKALDNDIENRLDTFKSTIEKLGGPDLENALKVEKQIGNSIRLEAAKLSYRQLDIGFLKISNRVIRNSFDYCLPRFGIYPIYSSNKINIFFRLNPIFPSVDMDIRFIPESIMDKYIESLNLGSFEKDREYDGKSVKYLFNSCSEKKKNLTKYDRYSFTSELNILVPDDTKQNIDKALEIFRKDELFFVAEIKPEDWNMRKIEYEPLIIGYTSKTAFVIDSFDVSLQENNIQAWIK